MSDSAIHAPEIIVGSPADNMHLSRQIMDELLRQCSRRGTTHVFGLPGGGANLDLVEAAERNGLQFVLTHSESAAVIMASVFGSISGTPGVSVVTRGPGAASALNGVAHALLDRQPVILITDSVSAVTAARTTHQNLELKALFRTVCKTSATLTSPDASDVEDLIQTAMTQPPGPVHVDIDISGEAPEPAPVMHVDRAAEIPVSIEELLERAERPVVIAGVGMATLAPPARSLAANELESLTCELNIPVLTTYRARGVVSDYSRSAAGVFSGATIEAPVLEAADLIIGIGLDPVEMIPGPWNYAAPVILFNSWSITRSQYFGDTLAAEVLGDINEHLSWMAGVLRSSWSPDQAPAWRRAAINSIVGGSHTSRRGLSPQDTVLIANQVAPDGTIVTVDAGAHMLPAMHLWCVGGADELFISSGLATMGFSLPAAIAASLAKPERRVICFTGDGGLGMVLAELETLARLNLPVTVVVFNDAALSLIALKQRPNGQGNSNAVTYRRTDFAAVANAHGVRGYEIDSAEHYRDTISDSLGKSGPSLLDVQVDATMYSQIFEAIRG